MCIAIVGTYVAEEGETYCRAAKSKILLKAVPRCRPGDGHGTEGDSSCGSELSAELVNAVGAGIAEIEITSQSFEQMMLPAVNGRPSHTASRRCGGF